MKSEKLLHAIGTIDDGLIFAARPAEKKKTPGHGSFGLRPRRPFWRSSWPSV